MPDDSSTQPFRAGWSIDYDEAYDSTSVEEVLSTEWQRELLLTDYENAGDDARNKETLLIQSFYVSLALFGFLLDIGYRLVQQAAYPELLGVSLLGAALFGLLSNWSVRYRQGRDASWDRRSEIEDFVARADPMVLRSNDSKFKRLARMDDGTYRLEEQPWYEAGSIATIVVYAELLIGLIWVAVGAWSVAGML